MNNYKIYFIKPSIPENIQIQILNLIDKNSNEIAINVFAKGSPIDNYMTMRELVKANIYFGRLDKNEPYKTHLLVTEDVDGYILGYVLYHKNINNPADISIISTIVRDENRGQGVLRNMIDVLKLNYKSISLSCFVEKVPIYKKLGFGIDCQFQTQIGMCYGIADDGGVMSIDEETLLQYDVVYYAFEKFKHSSGANFKRILEQLNNDNAREVFNAQRFIVEVRI